MRNDDYSGLYMLCKVVIFDFITSRINQWRVALEVRQKNFFFAKSQKYQQKILIVVLIKIETKIE